MQAGDQSAQGGGAHRGMIITKERRGGGMADASVSKTDVRKDVRVRLPLSAPRRFNDRLRGHRYRAF